MLNNTNDFLVIMAGGVGSRFWPYSRTKYPKQFHDILGTGKTMLQQTASRFEGIIPNENIYVVTNKIYADLVKQNLPFLTDNQILLEPSAKNTAPCIAFAAYKIAKKNPKANIVVSPADHFIQKEEEFKKTIATSLSYSAASESILTIGIVPTRPDTGYGYIQYDKNTQTDIKKVKRFAEKPNNETALQFLASGDFLWNGGLFIFKVQIIKQSFRKYMPDMDLLFDSDLYYTDREAQFIDAIYPKCDSISIDYGIMEKADNVHVILGYFGWSDVGTWKSVHDLAEKNAEKNVIDGNVFTYDTHDCIIKTPKDKLVVINGLDGYIVTEFDGVLMICKKDDEQKVKEFVADSKKHFGDKFI
ncbi:MAG: mannose-1-phosphate guanylyltransferase [Cytophagales bacterium]